MTESLFCLAVLAGLTMLIPFHQFRAAYSPGSKLWGPRVLHTFALALILNILSGVLFGLFFSTILVPQNPVTTASFNGAIIAATILGLAFTIAMALGYAVSVVQYVLWHPGGNRTGKVPENR